MNPLAWALVIGGLLGAGAEDAWTRDARFEVWLLTFGPGDDAFSKFGHNAMLIRVQDARGEPVGERVYNYGTFSFDSETLIFDFLQGNLRYWLSVGPLAATTAGYRSLDRSIVAQKLRLPHEAARALFLQLEDRALPKNRYYRYDYYLDNCSTRLRDLIDERLGGRLRAQLSEQKPPVRPQTLRQHTLRLTADDPLLQTALDIALAHPVDRTPNLWAETFLPEKLSFALSIATIDGAPLVEREEVWHKSGRPAIAARPPQRLPWYALLGAAIGATFALMGRFSRERRWARIGFSVSYTAFCVVFGLVGMVLLYLWCVTDHRVAWRNENVLQMAPWMLLAPVLLLERFARWRVRWAMTAAVFSALGLALKVLPSFDQDNARVLAMMLPSWWGAVLGLWAAAQKGKSLSEK